MLNVVFDAVTAGGLRLTKDKETDDWIQGKDIICLEWMLDIGYLREGIESSYRRELPGKMIMHGYYGEESEKGIPEIGEKSLQDWKTLINRLNKGEAVRIWYGDSPNALCGMYNVCTLLRSYDNDVFAMYAPSYAKGPKRWYLANSWGSFNYTNLGEYLDLQRLMDKNEIKLYAEHWDELVEENAPLRAVISGVPTSVDEDFYDRFLDRNLPDEPIKEAVLIGNTMSAYTLGIYSSWLEIRIQKMIDCGKIKVVTDSDEQAVQRVIQRYHGKGLSNH